MKVLRWLYQGQEITLRPPGTVIICAIIWSVLGTLRLLIDLATWLSHLL